MGSKVCKVVLEFLNSGGMLNWLNHTNIVFVPKISLSLSVNEYRPILLCNVLYKLIAKNLTNRLKNVLPHIISSYQSAFVLGISIIENVMVAFKLLHTMKTRRKGRVGSMALMLDMSKAYDRI